MFFQYSKTAREKKEEVKKNIIKKHEFTKRQNSNNMLIDSSNKLNIPEIPTIGLNMTDNTMDRSQYEHYLHDTNLMISNVSTKPVTKKQFEIVLGDRDNRFAYMTQASEHKLNFIPDSTRTTGQMDLVIEDSILTSETRTMDQSEFSFLGKTNSKGNVVEDKRIYRNVISEMNIKGIVNIYQSHYANAVSTGFGDYIRGSYYLMQFCDFHGIKWRIDLSNHMISLFLKYNSNPGGESIPAVYKYMENNGEHLRDANNMIRNRIQNNFLDFKKFLKVQTKHGKGTMFIHTICFPVFNVSSEHREKMRRILEPNSEVLSYTDVVLQNLALKKKQYTVIHIRFGDQHLVNNETILESRKLEILKRELTHLLGTNGNGENYLLLADNNSIKQYLLGLFPFLKTFFKGITHFGEGVSLEREKVRNTLVDFYLISYSRRVYSFSTYAHGSGFSYWGALTYEIPHTCKFIG